MITFYKDNCKFTYRVAGIAIDTGHVLLQRAEPGRIWFTPGGRAEFLETGAESLHREMREELNTSIHVERLLWIVENFFAGGDTIHHEIGLYFLISFPSGSALYDKAHTFHTIDAQQDFIFQWHAIETLDSLTIYPLFLQQSLRAIPEHTEHIVHNELKPS